MSKVHSAALRRSPLAAALFAALLVPGLALAQDQQSSTDQEQGATELDKVVVTGSLIPQSQVETFTPVTVITAEDIRARGFTNVSDVIQQASFATGGVQGSQSSASFTQGAETASLFGLRVSYTKYLIDGRPMADYPALYNGSEAFNNISGVPIELVERIEILPGGQSSLYGSDAIAGVINIILKKRLDAPVVSVRGGTYTEGGGDSGRVSAATSFSFAEDRFNVLLGGQYENREPIWGYQRDVTSSFYRGGTSVPIASRDLLVYGFVDLANSGFDRFEYAFSDPNNCANVRNLFGGTVDLRYRATGTVGYYCGSFDTPGYRTLRNEKESFQIYSHATFDVSDNHQLYGDVLYNDEKVGYHIGSNYTWWGTGVEWGYYYDPNLDGLVNLQRAFAPEDMGQGGFENSMSFDESKSTAVNLGIRGAFGTAWDYDGSLSRIDYKLNERSFARFADPINQWFLDNVLNPTGAPITYDPYFGAYPVFTPDYARFYQPIAPEDFRSFTGYTDSESKTENTLARFQITNSALFGLPGGDAGMALAVEAAREKWEYNPDPRLLNGEVWGTTSVDGAGERDRYAVTGELRLPLHNMLTASVSGRYDDYRPDGIDSYNKATYSVGLEFRPIESLLIRGKYGTAFKAPTLADNFQGMSGFYSFVTDYYACSQLGFDPSEVDACPSRFSNRQFFGETSGSPDLQPLNADVWSYGVVWAPTAQFSMSVDYHHWDIEDEIDTQNFDGLALREYYCRTGQPGFDINSPVCQDALGKIERDSTGQIVYIYAPKVNEARRVLDAVTASVSYQFDAGNIGEFLVRGSYTNNIKHRFWQFEGDEEIDILRRPEWSSDPKSKGNASITWSKNRWNSTFYVNYMGHTPNYRARVLGTYDDAGLQGVNGRVFAGKLDPFVTYNLSIGYRPLDNLSLSLMVNNLLNEMPEEDRTYPGTSGSPYNDQQYDVYGRAVYMEARWTFGN
nr:TonB-dependent receptor [Vulcaniibacterium thermophilum]